MNFTKKKSVARTQVNEFGTTTALVDAAKSDAQTVVTEVHAAADGMETAAARSATGLAPDAPYAQAELVVVPVSQSLAADKIAPLQANTLGAGFDGSKVLSSVYVDQSGGWGLQLAPDNVPDAGEQAMSGASEKALEAEVLELVKPVINAATDDLGAVGEIAAGGTTDDTTPTFSGYGEPFARLALYDNGVSIGDTSIEPDGRWSLTVSEPLDSGEHSFTVVVAGVASDPFMLTISAPGTGGPAIDAVLDSEGAIAELASGGTIGDVHPTFSGHGEPGALVQLYDGALYLGAATADEQGNWAFRPDTLLSLSDGEHVLTAVIGDVSSEPFVLHVDTAATAATEQPAGQVGEGALNGIALAELLQPAAAELLAGNQARILPVGDAAQVHDLSNEVFGSGLPADAQSLAAAHAVSAAVPTQMPVPAELWQPDTAT